MEQVPALQIGEFLIIKIFRFVFKVNFRFIKAYFLFLLQNKIKKDKSLVVY